MQYEYLDTTWVASMSVTAGNLAADPTSTTHATQTEINVVGCSGIEICATAFALDTADAINVHIAYEDVGGTWTYLTNLGGVPLLFKITANTVGLPQFLDVPAMGLNMKFIAGADGTPGNATIAVAYKRKREWQ